MLFAVMAEYSEPVKARGRDCTPTPFYLPHTTTDSQKWQFQALWKSLVSVDRGLCYIWEALFMQSEQTSLLISQV